MNERILNSSRRPRVANTLRSNCEAVRILSSRVELLLTGNAGAPPATVEGRPADENAFALRAQCGRGRPRSQHKVVS